MAKSTDQTTQPTPPGRPAPVTLTLARPWAAGLGAMLAIGWLGLGFGLGIWAGHGGTAATSATAAADPAPAATTPTTTTPSPSPSATAGSGTSSPFKAGAAFPFHTAVDTLHGQPTTLARGSRGTVVLAMASWCLFCAYEDKYVMPALAKTPGVAVDVVDVSPQGGIGDPGPQNPAFSGHDGSGGPLTVAGMEATMRQYVQTFGTLSAPNIHVYVAPTATQSAWNIQAYPTLAFLSANGRVAVAPGGAQTLSQAESDLRQAIG